MPSQNVCHHQGKCGIAAQHSRTHTMPREADEGEGGQEEFTNRRSNTESWQIQQLCWASPWYRPRVLVCDSVEYTPPWCVTLSRIHSSLVCDTQ